MTKEVAAAVGGLKDLVPTGTSVLIEGELTEAPAKAKQVPAQLLNKCQIAIQLEGLAVRLSLKLLRNKVYWLIGVVVSESLR